MLLLREPRYLEENWLSYKKRTRSVLLPSQCFLSQQRPLHLIPRILTQERGRFFNEKKGFKKPGGRGRGQGRPASSATITRPGQAKVGQKPLTISVASDSKKRKGEPQKDALGLLQNPSVIFERTRIKVINNEGVLPPQIIPVGVRLSNFVEGWKRITNDPYVLRIVAQGYRLHFTSPPLLCQTPWEIRSPQALEEILAMKEQIALMLQKNALTEVPPDSPGFYSNVFPVRKASGGWRPVIDLKNLNGQYPCTSFPYVHGKLCAKLCPKRRLRVKNRSAGCVLSRTYSSKQQKVPRVRLRKQGVPVSSASGISVISYLDDWLIHRPDCQVLLRHQAQGSVTSRV